jgi:hypothetical protein
MTTAEGADTSPAPEEFVSTTLKVYEVPFAKPVTVHDHRLVSEDDDVKVLVQLAPPGLAVTVK